MAFKKIALRAAYGYDTDAASDEAGLACLDESLAVQSERDEADINVIVRRFGVTGSLPQGVAVPTVQDFSEVANDYHAALTLIQEADAAFMQMPADVRSRFKNDAGAFVAFASDPANLDEMRKLGLAVPKVEEVVLSGADNTEKANG